MTNREKLASMTDEEIAVFICDMYTTTCRGCIGYPYCRWGEGHGNGILKWLQAEAEDE